MANIEGKLTQNDSKQATGLLDTFFDDEALKPSEMLLQVAAKTLRDDRRFEVFYEPFLICFSLNGNSLSQWRAYADDARGFSLGFPEDDLRKLSNNIDLGSDSLDLLCVVYDENEQKQMIDETVSMVTNHFDEAAANIDQEKRKQFVIDFNCYLFSCVVRLALHMKHPGFWEEKEVRLIYSKKANT